ncbi:E3 ubiquitin-protein ligase RSL1-like [Impatiens glandulifera]|uniref:E3 ubiquitin-protein ligase RSL1-like n=1 Tax=Impatiens glandulifera TaxID=253017 RepID=UPI001FB0E7FE|nr:E3 ubiquitin-protein ligase RSL1-like [Impatiens glandulifera]
MDQESNYSICEICAEKKEMIQLNTCSHSFCSDCITHHITTKLNENAKLISCLGYNCAGTLDLDSIRPWISSELAVSWEEMLCKSMIPESEMYYCPFSDCSVMMVDDSNGKETITQAECPLCHRLFCVQCRVPFHVGIECDEFLKLDKDERGLGDLMVRELAAKNKWRRCPNCRFYVEKKEGCLHITCRCGFQFCYACGANWSTNHGDGRRPKPQVIALPKLIRVPFQGRFASPVSLST